LLVNLALFAVSVMSPTTNDNKLPDNEDDDAAAAVKIQVRMSSNMFYDRQDSLLMTLLFFRLLFAVIELVKIWRNSSLLSSFNRNNNNDDDGKHQSTFSFCSRLSFTSLSR
jgi:hypothetical protein